VWQNAGDNQIFSLVSTGRARTFSLRMGTTGRYVSYSTSCKDTAVVGLRSSSNAMQHFRFVGNGSGVLFEWMLEAMGREGCGSRFVSVSPSCVHQQVYLDDETSAATFHLYPQGREDGWAMHQTVSNSEVPVADPFVWQVASQGGAACEAASGSRPRNSSSVGFFYQVGTGGNLVLMRTTPPLTMPTADFILVGSALGIGHPAPWAVSPDKWAPENYQHNATGGTIFFSAPSEGGAHRIGWVQSDSGSPSSWSHFSATTLDLGGAAGVIDPHVFRDDDGKTYLLWKSDDNAPPLNDVVTRLWMSEVVVSPGTVTMIGSPRPIPEKSNLQPLFLSPS